MPIEIRELVIKATVSDSGGSLSEPGEYGGPGRHSGSAVDIEAIVRECVRQVLEILARDAER